MSGPSASPVGARSVPGRVLRKVAVVAAFGEDSSTYSEARPRGASRVGRTEARSRTTTHRRTGPDRARPVTAARAERTPRRKPPFLPGRRTLRLGPVRRARHVFLYGLSAPLPYRVAESSFRTSPPSGGDPCCAPRHKPVVVFKDSLCDSHGCHSPWYISRGLRFV